MKNSLLRGLLVMLWIAGCSKLEDPDQIKPEDIIFVSVGKISLKADGKDTTHVTARIPVDAGNVDISFSASAGKFPVSGGQTISEYAQQKDKKYRYATVVFQSGAVPMDSVWITAEVTQARNRCKLSFVNQ